MFAKIENNQVVEWPIPSLAPLFPHTSFPAPLTPADVPEGYAIVGVMSPPTPGPSEKVIPALPIKQDAEWVQGWDVVPLPPEEIQQRLDVMAAQVRAERDAKLAASDWTQLPDAPVNVAVWGAYRRELRGITAQSGFPFAVQWPLQPERT